MWLSIEPNFEKKTLTDCIQKLGITAKKDITEISLDIAELQIHKILLLPPSSLPPSYSISDINVGNVNSDTANEVIRIKGNTITAKKVHPKIDEKNKDKLIIEFGERLLEGNKVSILIKYSAGYYFGNNTPQKPRSGFNFVIPNDAQNLRQAWTQGEPIESRYWFPCLDDPQIKYPREIQISVPDESFVAISNGKPGTKTNKVWTWLEETPNPAYLTSVVVSNQFDKEQLIYDVDGTNVELAYFWPNRISKKNAMRTFGPTPDILKFFEEYLGIKYPYSKYYQVAVDEFEYGGMENTSVLLIMAIICMMRKLDVILDMMFLS